MKWCVSELDKVSCITLVMVPCCALICDISLFTRMLMDNFVYVLSRDC